MPVTQKELIAAYNRAVAEKQRPGDGPLVDEFIRLDCAGQIDYEAQELEWRTARERTRILALRWALVALAVAALCFAWLCYMGIPQLMWEAWTR